MPKSQISDFAVLGILTRRSYNSRLHSSNEVWQRNLDSFGKKRVRIAKNTVES